NTKPSGSSTRRAPDGAPDPQDENGADRRHDQIAEPAVELDIEKDGEVASDERPGDADEQIGEEAVVARGRLLGDVAGDDADDEHADEAHARHREQGLRGVHYRPPHGICAAFILPHAQPHPDAQNGAESSDNDLAKYAIGRDPKKAGNKAADDSADDTDQEIDQEILLAPHDVRGDDAGDQANNKKVDNSHGSLLQGCSAPCPPLPAA